MYSQNDAVLNRLQESYTRQLNQQTNLKKQKLDSVLEAAADRHNELQTSLELLSDETAEQFNELESYCIAHGMHTALALSQKIRKSVNKELREALSYYEKGYVSAFESIKKDAGFSASSGALGKEASETTFTQDATAATHTSVVHENPEVYRLEQECPPEWKKTTKTEVASEVIYGEKLHVKELSAKNVSLKESFSEVLSLFAESLATLLVCEVVRIYLYDDYKNLHCCATYPFGATRGDPMRATHREIMIAKDIHRAVCDNGIAINGSEVSNPLLSARDVESVKAELSSAGLGGIKSCLAFPILSNLGINKSLGMIHAVNKVRPSPNSPSRFTTDDEIMASVCARVLGCTLTRYPMELFTLRVGEAFFKRIYPHEDSRRLDAHLPPRVIEEVQDAATVGNRAITSLQPIQVFRAPINNIYLTHTQIDRNRKLGSLVLADSTLASVEFNLQVTNSLWNEGLEENAVMHRQYREITEDLKKKKMLLRNVLDGVAAARSLELSADTAHFLQTIELLGRSESNDALREYVGETLIDVTTKASLRQPPRRTASPPTEAVDMGNGGDDPCPTAETPPSCTDEPSAYANKLKTDDAVDAVPGVGKVVSESPFLSPQEARELERRNRLANAKVASQIHFDGPESINHYSCDPEAKREQVRFIDEMISRRAVMNEQKRISEAGKAPHYESTTTSVQAKQCQLPSVPHRVMNAKTSSAKADATIKRPFALKQK